MLHPWMACTHLPDPAGVSQRCPMGAERACGLSCAVCYRRGKAPESPFCHGGFALERLMVRKLAACQRWWRACADVPRQPA